VELYEEARLLNREAYTVVPYAKGALDLIKQVSDGPIVWTLASEEVSRRL
jgi:hypothetical protein